MIKSKKLFAALSATIALSLTGCSHMFKVSDVGPIIQLPVSKQCFQVFTLSQKEIIYSPQRCEEIKARSIYLTPETWAILRGDIQRNCQYAQCKQITGAIDDLFLGLDRALQSLP